MPSSTAGPLPYPKETFSNVIRPGGGRDEGAGAAADFRLGVEHLEDAARRGQALLDGIGDRRQVRHVAGELLEQAGEDDQAAARAMRRGRGASRRRRRG